MWTAKKQYRWWTDVSFTNDCVVRVIALTKAWLLWTHESSIGHAWQRVEYPRVFCARYVMRLYLARATVVRNPFRRWSGGQFKASSSRRHRMALAPKPAQGRTGPLTLANNTHQPAEQWGSSAGSNTHTHKLTKRATSSDESDCVWTPSPVTLGQSMNHTLLYMLMASQRLGQRQWRYWLTGWSERQALLCGLQPTNAAENRRAAQLEWYWRSKQWLAGQDPTRSDVTKPQPPSPPPSDHHAWLSSSRGS